MNKLIIIDGNALLHRAYHALPPLKAPDGTVINALYGFFSMLLKILEDQKPQYLVVCFDRPKPTFRQQLFAGYHENRAAMADDMLPQIALVHDALEKANISIFELDGYEADDLIGTCSKQAIEHKLDGDIEVIIVSGDRDMLQLVNKHTKVLMPVVGITKMNLMDEEAVKEKYGITSSQFVDYKALIGDASDNYPGVSGIGPKTAAKLLEEYGTFENLYLHLGELPERIGRMLAKDAEQAALAKKLAIIVTDAPVHLRLEKCKTANFNSQEARKVFERLGIKSLQNRLP